MAKKEPTLAQIISLMSEKFSSVLSQLQSIQADMRHMKVELKKHGEQLEEIGEVLGAVSRAVDKDAVTIMEYGRRIARLEKVQR